MNPWTLVWEPAAEQMLASVYLVAFDQAAVTRAVYGAEALLTTDPTRPDSRSSCRKGSGN